MKSKPKKKINHNSFLLNVILYGIILAALVFILKYIEYRYIVRQLRMEVYIAVIASLFTLLGIWVGLKLINRKKNPEVSPNIKINQTKIKELNISKREYELLDLISKGFSNQEIADKLFISIPTVKTHLSNLFSKLNVQRRTQAIHKAKELKIIN